MPISSEHFIERYRGWLIVFFALPASFVVRQVTRLRQGLRQYLSSPQRHQRAVECIQAQVREAAQQGKRMCTARRPWDAMSFRIATYKKTCVQINLDLSSILSLDTDNNTVRVEPMATMIDVSRYLMRRGYALAVQPEMDDLTIGGVCMGVGIETSSHRHGFISETVTAYEIVTADGQLLRATDSEHRELFYSLPWSHGTLGFLVAVELKVIPAKRYMQLQYIPCHSQEALCQRLQKLAAAPTPPAYLEALVFSPTTAMIICGELTDKPSGAKFNPIKRFYKPWFHEHVASLLAQGETREYMPLQHYFHRHTASIFFQLQDLIPFADQAWYRYGLAWLGAPKVSLLKRIHSRDLRRKSMHSRTAQDIIIPIETLATALDFIHPHYEIYPLWLCPVKLFRHEQQYGLLREPEKTSMYIDVGIYGIPGAIRRHENFDMIATSQALEKFTLSLNGCHMLYADIFMNKAEFENMFAHQHYRAMRKHYHAETTFPEVYEKITPEAWLYDANAND